jgi:alpha-glucoside transport system permease protein
MTTAGASPPAAATTPAVRRPSGPVRLMRGWNWTASLFLAPAVFLLAVFMVYPVYDTIQLSFDGGLEVYRRLFDDKRFIDLTTFPPKGALFNNLLWAILFPAATIAFGLFIAVLSSRVRYEAAVKAIVFIPQAIAATALGVIWRFVFFPDPETGLLNAFTGLFGISRISWLGDVDWVNYSLIIAGVWASVGFATVILSAAIKGINPEILEAARTDGATEGQIFRRIMVPMLSLPISVVAVTLLINVIKLFDLIYVMTNGGPANRSWVIGFTFYREALAQGNLEKGAAVAVVMMLLLVPVMAFNVRRFRTARVVQ